MPGDPSTPYNTLIDYEGTDLDVRSVGDYQVMNQITETNFDIDKKSVGEILTNWNFEIPEYQRLYSWKRRQHRQIWSEIQRFIDAELVSGQENVSDVFFGSMYFAVKDNGQTYEVIDGQQRLTSIYILLRVILEKLESLGEPTNIEDPTVERLRENGVNHIRGILYETDVMQGQHATLRLNKHDDEFFDALIQGESQQKAYLASDERSYIDGRKGRAEKVSSLVDAFDISEELAEEIDDSVLSEFVPVYESNHNLLNAYGFYREKIEEIAVDAPDDRSLALLLVNLNNYLQNSYYVGRFEIRRAEPDFRMQIFEILNDRGLELTKIDRIRANVVNTLFDEADKDEYVDKWERIVTSFGADSSQVEAYLSVYLSIVEHSVSSTGEASSELLNAFSSRNIDSDVTPRLAALSSAREFLDEAEALVPLFKEITEPQLDDSDLRVGDEYRSQCEEILNRLDELGTSQWYPLVLALYDYTVNEPSGSEEEFYEALEVVEKLNLRRLLTDANPNVFENVFVECAHVVDECRGGDEREPYDAVRKQMVETVRSNAPQLFSDGFADTIIQAHSWDTRYAKLILAKISNRQFRAQSRTVDHQLNMESIHPEHVLPRSLLRGSDNDATWPREFFKVESGGTEIVDEVAEYIELGEKAANGGLDEEAQQRRDDIESYLHGRFVQDIGNFLLLRDRDNISASDRPLSEKLIRYHNAAEDFDLIPVNRYFTAENDDIDDNRLSRLLRQARERDRGERSEVDDDIVEYFDSFWTYESLKDRRVDLVLDVLEALSFDEIDDEFDLNTNRDTVKTYVREQTDDEFEKRLSMRSL